MSESELIRRAFGEPEEDYEAVAHAHARLLDAIRVERSRRRRRRLVLPAAAAVAITTTIAIALSLIGPFGEGVAAATELQRLATIALSRSAREVGSGEFLLIVSDELRRERIADVITGSSYTIVSRLHIRTWIARDGAMFRSTEVLSSRFANEADRHVWEEKGGSPIPQPGEIREEKLGPGQGFWVDLESLPADPLALLSRLRSGSVAPRAPGDDQVYLLIGELLAQGDGRPEVRAALFRAAARLEGVELVGGLADPLGRGGIALAMDAGSLRTQLIFDPETAELLAIELHDIGPDGSAAEEPRSWSAFRTAMVVDASPGERH